MGCCSATPTAPWPAGLGLILTEAVRWFRTLRRMLIPSRWQSKPAVAWYRPPIPMTSPGCPPPTGQSSSRICWPAGRAHHKSKVRVKDGTRREIVLGGRAWPDCGFAPTSISTCRWTTCAPGGGTPKGLGFDVLWNCDTVVEPDRPRHTAKAMPRLRGRLQLPGATWILMPSPARTRPAPRRTGRAGTARPAAGRCRRRPPAIRSAAGAEAEQDGHRAQ